MRAAIRSVVVVSCLGLLPVGLGCGPSEPGVGGTPLAGGASDGSSAAGAECDRNTPDTFILTGPELLTSAASATFIFASTVAGATFECRLDAAGYAACRTPLTLTALADGAHTLQVRAVARHQRDPSPASYGWTVDRTAPAIRDVACPAATVASGDVTITFASDDASAGFTCTMDGAAATCTSPKAYAGLATGAHLFSVVATDAAQNASAPSACRFTVAPPAPELVLAGSSPQENDCTRGDGTALSRASGQVDFFSSDTTATTTYLCTLHDLTSQSSTSATACVQDATTGGPAGTPVQMHYPFRGLIDGHLYSLVIEATGASGAKGTLRRTWMVDASNPTIVFARFHPGDTGFEDVAVQQTVDGAGYGVTNTGFFTDVDPVDGITRTTYTCAIDGGPAAPCTVAGGYPVAALAEGQHTVKVTGSDCVLNTGSATYTFYMDRTAPAAFLTAHSPYVATSADHLGNVALDVSVVDPASTAGAYSNVAAVYCILDDLASTVFTTPCAALSSPAPRALPTNAGETTYTATLSFSHLAPGEHVIRYKASDHWGHLTQNEGRGSFIVDYNGNVTGARGHAVVIGNDYGVVGPGDPLVNVLGNAVRMSAAASFTRPVRVLLVKLGAPSAEEVGNLAWGICARLCAWKGDATCACDQHVAFTETPDYGFAPVSFLLDPTLPSLASAVLGQDVVVFADVNDDAGTAYLDALTVDPTWTAFVSELATRGVTFIAASGRHGAGDVVPSRTYEAIPRALLDVTVDADGSTGSPGTFLECESTDPLAATLPGETWASAFGLPASSASFVNNERTRSDTNMVTEVYEMDGRSAMGELQTHPFVLHKYFPRRATVGPVYVDAWWNGAAASRSSSRAFFQDGSTVTACMLHEDGTVSREVRTDALVTIGDNTLRAYETLYDLAPYEHVVVGQSRTTPVAVVQVDLAELAAMTGRRAATVAVSSGCETRSVSLDVDLGRSTMVPLLFSPECQGADGNYGIVAGVEDPVTGRVDVLFAKFANSPDALNATAFGSPLAVSNQTVAPSPFPVPPLAVSTQADDGLDGIWFDQGLVANGLTGATNYNQFATFPYGPMRTRMTGVYPAAQTQAQIWTRLSRETPGAPIAVDLAASELLPRITFALVNNTVNVNAALRWDVDAEQWGGARSASSTLAEAVVGEAVLAVESEVPGTSCSTVPWVLNFTPARHPTSLTLPLIPAGVMTCTPGGLSTSSGTVSTLGVAAVSTLDAIAAHRAMGDLVVSGSGPRGWTVLRAADRDGIGTVVKESVISFSP